MHRLLQIFKILFPVFFLLMFAGHVQATNTTVKAGMVVYGVGTLGGVELGSIYQENFHFNVSLYWGNNRAEGKNKDEQDSSTVKEFLEANVQVFSIEMRYFPGLGSFNITGLLSQWKLKGSYGFANKFAEASVPFNSEVSQLGVAIGNEWSWDGGFMMGCDWLEIKGTLLATTETQLSGPEAEAISILTASKGGPAKQANHVAQSLSALGLLNFYIGWRF